MEYVSKIRLYVLRAMYLFIALGLISSSWSDIFSAAGSEAGADTVIHAFLIAMILLSIVGIYYPLKMLPILFFEMLWKLVWLVVFALPLHLKHGLDEYATAVVFACAIGVILTPLVIPWGYVMRQFIGVKESV